MTVISNDTNLCQQALESLKAVNDPEIGLNIVDLGLVYQIDFDQADKKIYLQMTLTTQYCPMGQSIMDQAKAALEERFPGDEIDIILTFDPRWNADMISEQGKMFLNR